MRVDANDDFGREHLLRYCARPPLSLARLVELPAGKLGYRIKKLRNHPPDRPSHNHAPKPAPPPPDDAPTPRSSRAPRALAPTHLVPRTEPLGPNDIAVNHWDRLKSGALLAASPRVDWSTLMRRTFDVDVLECPKCASRLRVLAIVDSPDLALQVLAELGIARAPPPLPATDPATLDADPDAAC